MNDENLKKIKENSIILDDSNEVKKYFSTIHGTISNEIKEDFVFASFSNGENGEKKKKYIIEMTYNAYQSKNLLKLMGKRIDEKLEELKFRTNLDPYIKQKWIEKLNTEKEIVKKYEELVFNTIMNKVNMLVILNRNVEGNYLINRLSDRDKTLNGIPQQDDLKTKMLEKEN